MPALSSLSMYIFQTPVDATGTDLHLITIFVGIIALFFLLVMIGVLIGAIYAMKMVKKVEAKVNALELRGEQLLTEVKAKAYPIVTMTHEIIEDLQPKIRTVSDNVVAISNTAKAKVDEVGETVSKVNFTVQDVNGKTQQQVQRVNGIVTDALTATHNFSNTVQHGIRVPINKVAGWIAGLKAGLQHLAEHSPLAKKAKGPVSPYDL